MRNRRKEQELKEQIIALRIRHNSISRQLNQKMAELYIAMGFTPDQAAKMI